MLNQSKQQNDTAVVRRIIMDTLKDNQRVSKYYVIEKMKSYFMATHLYNKVLARKRDCNDVRKKLHRGAQLIFSDSWRRLKREFEMDSDGWIRPRNAVKQEANPRTDADVMPTVSVRRSGHVGQEIIDADGRIIAWTTDLWAAQVICKLLNEHQDLLLFHTGQSVDQ